MTPRTTRARFAWVVTLAASWIAAPHVWAQSVPVLTLAQAVSEALAKNDRLLTQHDSIVQADLGVRLAQNAFRPKVTPNVLGSFGQTNVNSQTYGVDVSQEFVTGTGVRFSTGTASSQIPALPGTTGGDVRFYNADTTLTLSQPLLRGLGPAVTRESLTRAELGRADAGRQQTLAEQQVAIDVAAAYFRVVSETAFVDIAKKSVERARRLREASEAKLGAGIVSQLDVLRAQQLVAEAESQLVDAQSLIEDAHDDLTFLLGRPSSDRFDVETAIPRPDDTPIDVDQATSTALSNRLDLAGRAADRADADREVRSARNQLLPQVDVNLALTRRKTSDTFAGSFRLDGFQFATFFTIATPVDRTAQQVAFETAVIDRDRRAREITTLERQLADDVKRGVRERERLLRGVTAAETNVEISQQEVDVAELRYEKGLSNNLDVVAAEGNLLAAEARRIQALTDAVVGQLRLRATLGILNPRQDVGR